ncbi:MAG: hypothetical protein C207_03601 [Bradyrhizobium sp. DFCI-1]|jgi:hypothetical protein|nr:MAG: hypothetical protein C207_03601 [Bradyrhizobium sp. DFCI-1]
MPKIPGWFGSNLRKARKSVFRHGNHVPLVEMELT